MSTLSFFIISALLILSVLFLKVDVASSSSETSTKSTEWLRNQYQNSGFTRYSVRQRDDYKSRAPVKFPSVSSNVSRDDHLLRVSCRCPDGCDRAGKCRTIESK